MIKKNLKKKKTKPTLHRESFTLLFKALIFRNASCLIYLFCSTPLITTAHLIFFYIMPGHTTSYWATLYHTAFSYTHTWSHHFLLHYITLRSPMPTLKALYLFHEFYDSTPPHSHRHKSIYKRLTHMQYVALSP